MFKSFHGSIRKNTNQDQHLAKAASKQYLAIHDGQTLLLDEKRHQLIQKFASQLCLSDENYQLFCTPLLTSFAEFVQELPETRNSYYSHTGGLLDHALERSGTALALLRAYFLPEGSDKAPLTEPQTLWAYAVFSASLLHDVGKVITDLDVQLFDKNRQSLRAWNPFAGTMKTQDGHIFDYDFLGNFPDTYRRRVTILLARQIMPEAGFQWICSNRDVLQVWLALLEDDQRGAGTLGKVLWQADGLVINRRLLDARPGKKTLSTQIEPMAPSSLKPSFDTAAPKEVSDKAALPGEDSIAGKEFLKWLYLNLDTAKLMINKAPLFYVPGAGLVFTPEIFALFIRDMQGRANSPLSPSYLKDSQHIQRAVAALGLHTPGADGGLSHSFIRMSDNKHISGMVIANLDAILPPQFKVMPAQGPNSSSQNMQAFAHGQGNKLAAAVPQTVTIDVLLNSSTVSSMQYANVISAGSQPAKPLNIAPNGQFTQEKPRASGITVTPPYNPTSTTT